MNNAVISGLVLVREGRNAETCSQWRDAEAMTLVSAVLGSHQRSCRNLDSCDASPVPSSDIPSPFREARITSRQTAVPTSLQLQHGLLRHLVRSCDRRAQPSLGCTRQQLLALPLALGTNELTYRSRMVNFAVAAFIVLGGVAKLFPFNDL